MAQFNESDSELESAERREVLSALMKYSAVVGGASATVLSASEAVARSAASGAQPVRKDKWLRMQGWTEEDWQAWGKHEELDPKRIYHLRNWWERTYGGS